MKRAILSLIMPMSIGIVAQPGPIHIPDSLLHRGFQAQPLELTRVCLPPPWSFAEPILSVPTSYLIVTADSTPYRRVDSLKRAVDSIVLLHQSQSTEITARHQKAITQVQAQSQELASTLARYRKLFLTALALMLALIWMLFRVRRAAKRGKPLVLRHECAHEPTAGLS
jgi:hypothetical protein